MHVTFIVTSYWAYGELLIALEFARQLRPGGWTCHFFIPPSHEKILKEAGFPYTLLIPRLGDVNRVLFKDHELRYRPRFVILSDFLNYHFSNPHYGLRMEDLRIFSGRVGTFDNFDWTLARRQMDTYGFAAKTLSEVDIQEYGFRLVPCPIVSPLLHGRDEPRAIYYPLLGEVPSYDEALRSRRREELGLPQDKPVVLVTSAVWQQTHRAYPNVQSFVAAADEVYHRILMAVAQEGVLLWVGAAPPGLPDSVKVLDQLPPEVFEKYAQAADLFITRNLTSTTVAKFALAGLPVAVLTSSLHFTARSKASFRFPFRPTAQVEAAFEKLESCYPYRMYPVGWYTFLGPVMEGNPYRSMVRELELFDEEQTVASISQLLASPAAREESRHGAAAYRSLLERLPRPLAVLERLGLEQAA